MRAQTEMRVRVVGNATEGVPARTSDVVRDSPLSRSALALVALHRTPLLAAECGLAHGDQRRRVMPLEKLADPRPSERKVGLGAPQVLLRPLQIGLQPLDARRRTSERSLGASASA